MKKYILPALIAMLMIGYGCETKVEVKEEPLIGKKEIKLETDRMTPEVLWSLGRVGEFEVSPDHKKILFSITYYDINRNKGNREIYTMSIDGKDIKQLTQTPENEFNYCWHPEGKKIFYLSTASGSAQVWEMNPDGTGKKKITNIEGGINGFKFSPDLKKIAYSAEVKLEDTYTGKLFEGLDKTSGKIYNGMMFRHWDEWRETYSHLFIADMNGDQVTNVTDLLKGEPYDVPNKPFGGMEQIAWHPDGKQLAYSCHKKDGRDYAVSTNTDIYIYNLETGQTDVLTKGMMGYDNDPAYSPDGKYIAWTSMERDGYEADKNRLMIYDLENKSRVLTGTVERKYST